MKFYGRKNELALIGDWFSAAEKGTLFTAIIGRRRIGKTRLWLEASREKENSIYLFCLPGPVSRIFEQVEHQLFEIGFTAIPQTLNDFLRAISLLLSKGKALILFLDEVQHLFQEEKENLALFQYYVDDFKRKEYPFLIVFCGSVRTLLHAILYDRHSPLYGRIDHTIHLKPLGFYVFRDLFLDQGIHAPQRWLRLFSLFGANPRFYEILTQFDLLTKPTANILEKSYMGLMGLFSDELNKMLVPELKKLSHVYSGVLSAMATFHQDANEIANQAGIRTTSLGNYLPFLMDDLDLVRKEISVTEKPGTKISRYVIKDPFIYFWYRYIERSRTLLEMGQTKRVVQRIVEDLPNLEGHILEKIMREKILAKPPISFDLAGPVFKHREGIEIDFLLASEKENHIHAFEFKRGSVDKNAVARKLIHKTARLRFKSIRLHEPGISATVLTTQDI